MMKEFFGSITVVIALISYVPYIKDILAGKTKPHIFSWLVWTVLTFVVLIVQLGDNAGPGAWSTAVTGLICLGILLLALRQGSHFITRTDIGMLIAAGVTLVLWITTKNPTLSALLITMVDAAGFIPTMRKSWHLPHSETLATYVLTLTKHVISLFAMRNVSLITSLYPGYLVVANLVMVLILLIRRRAVKVPNTRELA